LRDRCPEVRLDRLGRERALDRVQRQARVAFTVEVEEPSGDRVLTTEIAREEARVVGVDGDERARGPELAERMRVERGNAAETEIRRWTHRERDAAADQLGEQGGVLGGADAVLDAIGTQGVERTADRRGPGVLAGVRRGAEPTPPCLGEEVPEGLGRE